MIVPLVTRVVELGGVLGGLGSVDSVELVRSARGRPALKVSRGGSTHLYSLEGEPALIASASSPPSTLRVGGVRIEVAGSEVVVATGGREFRGSGVLREDGTLVYFIACRRSRCRAGVLDLVDGLARLYDVDADGLRPAELRGSSVSLGAEGFSVASRSLTVSVSLNGVELLPGFFRFAASCPSGDYLVDREGLLVRVRRGLIDVLGRVYEPASAACLSDGVVVADREGLKVVRYGAYTTVIREAVRELSSFRDVVSVVSRAGLVRILSSRDFYTLDSPSLKSCKSTERGVACLTESAVVFLDPGARAEVAVGVASGGEEGVAEVSVRPWFEGCRLSVAPRLVGLLEQVVEGGALRARLYPRILGWEGYVRVTVECPTYHRSVEEYVRFGGLELRGVAERHFTVVESGRVWGSGDSNCAGRATLAILSRFPVPIPLEARAVGLEGASVELSKDAVTPGLNEVSVRLIGKCSGDGGILISLRTGPGLLEPNDIATVYFDPAEFEVVRWDPREEVEISEAEQGSVVRAPGSHLRLYCSNGRVFEGRDGISVEGCEEPALLEVTRVVEESGEVFELSSSRVLRDAVRKCLSGTGSGRAFTGGFYADCGKYEAALGEAPRLKVEHGDGYGISVYLGGAKVLEQRLDPVYLLTGLSVALGPGRVEVDWRKVLELALRTALSVGRYVEGLVGERGNA